MNELITKFEDLLFEVQREAGYPAGPVTGPQLRMDKIYRQLLMIRGRINEVPRKTTPAIAAAGVENVEAVRDINRCLDLDRLARVPQDRYNRFLRLMRDGQVVLSGDPTGFHLGDDGAVIDCSIPKT